MNDKELLELAAKSSSKDISWESSNMFGFWAHDLETGCEWNPLTNNNDALNLVIDLGLIVGAHTGYSSCSGFSNSGGELHEEHNEDKYAATRRAIVRAAAEIGKTMS